MNAAYVKDLIPDGGWLDIDEPRLQPLEDEQLNVRQKLLLSMMLKAGTARCTNLFRTMFRNLRIYLPFARLNSLLMPKGKLSRRHTELAILRIGWKHRSSYEWGQHVDIGLRIGLTTADIYRVTQGANADGWDEREALVLTAVDELIDDRHLSASTWDALSGNFNQKLVIELMFLITTYSGLASILNTVGVQLEPEIQEILSTTALS